MFYRLKKNGEDFFQTQFSHSKHIPGTRYILTGSFSLSHMERGPNPPSKKNKYFLSIIVSLHL